MVWCGANYNVQQNIQIGPAFRAYSTYSRMTPRIDYRCNINLILKYIDASEQSKPILTTIFVTLRGLSNISLSRLFQGVVVFGLLYQQPLQYQQYTYPPWAVVLGWGLACSSILMIPVVAIYKLISTPGTFREVGVLVLYFVFSLFLYRT